MTFSPKVDGRRNKVLLGGLSSAGVFPAISLTAYANTPMKYVAVEAKTWTLHPDGSVSIVRPDDSNLNLEAGTFVLTDGQIFVLAEDTVQEIYGLLFFFGGTALAVGIGGQGPAGMETVIEGSDSGMVTEDGAAGSSTVATGKLSVSDRADDAALFVSQDNISARYGTFSITTTGEWTYTLNNDGDDVQGLGEDDQLEDAIIARSIDGTEVTIDISIQGSNDEAEVTGDDTGGVIDGGTSNLVGTLTVADIDDNEATFQAQGNLETVYGSFSIDQQGTWAYVLGSDNHKVMALAEGQTAQDTIVVLTADGTEQESVITVTGSGSAELTIQENSQQTGYFLENANPAGDALTWSIGTGGNSALFQINGTTNEVEFVEGNVPDFDSPGHAAESIRYELALVANEGEDTEIRRSVVITVEERQEHVVTLIDSNGSTMGFPGWAGLGWSYAAVGDLNEDGFDDIVVSSGLSSVGSYVVYGNQSLQATALSRIDLHSDDLISDELPSAISNPLVASAGDLNRDGASEFFVANSYLPNGSARYFNGSVILTGENNSAPNQLSILGITTKHDSTVAPATIGDIDGDGFEDLAIVSLMPDSNNSDKSDLSYYVIFSSPQPASDTASSVHQIDFRNETPSDTYETAFKTMSIDGTASDRSPAISALGDINSDGIDDFILTSSLSDAAYVVFGEQRNSNGELSFDGTPSVTISGLSPSGQSNAANNIVLAAADINGDGINDIILGSPESDPDGRANAGQTFVLFGRESDDPWGDTFNLNDIDGTNGFVITGADAGDQIGRGVANAGDVNGDGVDDLVITQSNTHGYVVFGSQDIFGDPNGNGTFNVDSLDGSNGFKIQTHWAFLFPTPHRPFLPADDLNQDGYDDLMIGDPTSKGLYILFGAPVFDNIVDIDFNNPFG